MLFKSFSEDSVVIVYKTWAEARYAARIMGQTQVNHRVIPLGSFGSGIYERAVCDYSVFVNRGAALAAILHTPKKIVITTVEALNLAVPPAEYFLEHNVLAVHSMQSQQALVTALGDYGYMRGESVTSRGQYAVRGGIVDIYPPLSQMPVRVDFLGDEIDLIRSFDTDTQLSGTKLESVVITKCSEIVLNGRMRSTFSRKYRGNDARLAECVENGNLFPGIEWYLSCFHEDVASVLSYFSDDTKFIFDFEVEKFSSMFLEEQMRKSQYPPVSDIFFDSVSRVATGTYQESDHGVRGRKFTVERVDPLTEPNSSPQPQLRKYDIMVRSDLLELIGSTNPNKKTVLSVASTGAYNLLMELLNGYDVKEIRNFFEAEPGRINVIMSDLKCGFVSDELIIYTETELFGQRLKLAKKRSVETYRDCTKLTVGDYVVHEMHGIAAFDGLIQFDVSGVTHEFINLRYNHGDRLYVPIENISVISRYSGGDVAVQLDSLKANSWTRRRDGVRKKLIVIANDLLKTAAARKCHKLQPLAIPDNFDRFCSGFGHTETEDQMAAISDVMGDLFEDYPMDRLVCGDVGFGKTEVALRAAFIAASSGKQVVLLTPTTILVSQHFQTFQKRFNRFDIGICSLSRFISQRQIKENISGIASGDIKIIIATHTVLSRKITFHDLGLVIVDEEQHFGVKQKEFMKEINPGVHYLTLSATPIPRTLQLSVSGVKDLSMITTPPVNRLPVKTICCDFDRESISAAIDMEIKAGGQVFFVTPRIEYLGEIHSLVTNLFPNLRVVSIHGKSQCLDQTVMDFCDHKIDIMVTTNIIDSGIDIPNANTILIHRFDLFGLAQVYQLRGRVGRSSRQAYAYLLLQPDRTITDSAMDRLEALKKLDSLGSGVNLANYDLELRGPGNLLGSDQAGFIADVGIELYQSMLQEAILMLKAGFDELHPEKKEPKISLGVPILIPDSYIEGLNLRLELYRRIGAVKEPVDVSDMEFELSDRFGRIPYETKNLLDLMRIRIDCLAANIGKLDITPRGLAFSFFEESSLNIEALLSLLHSDAVKTYRGVAKIVGSNKVVITKAWPSLTERTRDVLHLISHIRAVLEDVVRPPAN
ncbi:MAG: transcription-repair coupling factor [Holosporales bacterium]|jgi:transcription-repair coupling factor (superfamily II helicase)|nr:transcription-repair coupling factor [Holosporales bacterium]